MNCLAFPMGQGIWLLISVTFPPCPNDIVSMRFREDYTDKPEALSSLSLSPTDTQTHTQTKCIPVDKQAKLCKYIRRDMNFQCTLKRAFSRYRQPVFPLDSLWIKPIQQL